MSKVFVISDTHFGHKNIIQFEKEKRPYKTIEEHDQDLLQRWNAVVKPEDTIWHLGDVYFSEGWKVLPHLNGKKRLVLGNHDAKKEDVLMRYFHRIYGVATWNDYILSHVPVHPYQLGDKSRFKGNIHGHMHSKRVFKQEFDFAELGPDPNYFCVSVEQTGLKPILMEDAVKRNFPK